MAGIVAAAGCALGDVSCFSDDFVGFFFSDVAFSLGCGELSCREGVCGFMVGVSSGGSSRDETTGTREVSRFTIVGDSNFIGEGTSRLRSAEAEELEAVTTASEHKTRDKLLTIM